MFRQDFHPTLIGQVIFQDGDFVISGPQAALREILSPALILPNRMLVKHIDFLRSNPDRRGSAIFEVVKLDCQIKVL